MAKKASAIPADISSAASSPTGIAWQQGGIGVKRLLELTSKHAIAGVQTETVVHSESQHQRN